jgi:cytochrome c oxidase assembly protein subunit 15
MAETFVRNKMRADRYRPVLFWLAVATAGTAVLPIVVGALVTTLDAGMAFPDWPTSDGHGMFAYPWLKSAGAKFVEHGHRLAGITIGCVSILFAAATWFLESRRWVRIAGVGVLLAVIAQGLLGGQRVLADDKLFALFHGAFAAAVFTYMASMALVLSGSWVEPPFVEAATNLNVLRIFAAVTPLLVVAQYSLGGLVRHLGTALFEHAGMALVVLAWILATVWVAHRTEVRWLERPALLMGMIAVCQVLLGAGTWVTKYGLASVGYVAVYRAPLQVAVRTSHTVVAMLLLMTSAILLLRLARVQSLCRVVVPTIERVLQVVPSGSLPGGVR